MQKTIEVVDNFYRDPMAVRELALRSEWMRPSAAESRMYEARTRLYTADKETKERLSSIIGQPPSQQPDMALNGFFTFIGQGASAHLVPHIHDTDLAAVIYLSLPNQCSGGISFYRHLDAGIPNSAADTEPTIPLQEWEETTYIPMQFNRMVLFRASILFHRASSGFGQAPESGRLAQVFFFNEMSAVVKG